MPGRIHQNDAPSLTLDSPISVGDTIIPVQESITGVETPISYVINSGGANEEIVTLTSKNTSTSPSQFEDVVRGCDGTADQSHSSGEVLTHEATARDLVDKNLVNSFGFKPSKRLKVYEDFDVPDQTGVGGFELQTGQSLTVQQGGADIVDGSLRPTADDTVITFSLPTGSDSVYLEALVKVSSNDQAPTGIIWSYNDLNNYHATRTKGDGSDALLEMITKDAGSFFVENTAVLSIGSDQHQMYRIKTTVGSADPVSWAGGVHVQSKELKLQRKPGSPNTYGIIGSTDTLFESILLVRQRA